MPYLFLKSIGRYLVLIGQLLVSPVRNRRRLTGFLLLLVGLPVFLMLQLLHWVTFLLDEILFRGYRHVEITEPVFVLGPPRSGTTHLHHVLSADPDTTTFRTWECLFGLSVSSRKLLLALGRLDRAIGGPVGWLGSWIGRKFFTSMDDIHPLSLDEPEEDFLCLMPLAACFLLVIPFPDATWLWRMARFDTELDDREKSTCLRWYRRNIQKHLYVFGPHKRFLSKNASFSGMPEALLHEFPDARILFTVRDPLATVPSQLSSLRPALKTCGFPQFPDALRDALVGLLHHYYVHLASVAQSNPNRVAMLYNEQLRDRLAESVLHSLASVGIEPGDNFDEELQVRSEASRQHASGHRYTLEEFGLSRDEIRARFDDVYTLYDFESGTGSTEQR
jgi:hypothetical protein